MQPANHDTILSDLEIRAEPFALCALEGACSLGLGRNSGAALHYVLEGSGALSFPAHPALPLTPGRLVLVPASVRHSLNNDGRGKTTVPACAPAGLDLDEHLARGDGAGRMLVLCSTVQLSLRNTHGLVDLLRAPLSLDTGQAPVAGQAIKALLHEMRTPRAGRKAMIRLLILQCVTEMLRTRLEAGDPMVLWLTGLADPGLWQALRAMLDDPGAPHTVDSLSDTAGMSRSRFAERFQGAYGHAPMTFLRQLRLARAAQLLVDGQVPVKQVARTVGFTSRSAFTRAFADAWGQPPGVFRRAAT
mgnify:CR=1 FL=1